MSMPERVAGVVLAAGAGRRFGMPKALVEYGGVLLVERAVQVLVEGGCDPVLVILGAAADEVTKRADLLGSMVVVNPDWPTGMGSSLRTALDTLTSATRPDDVHGALVLPVDMPGVSTDAVRRVRAHASATALAAATYGDRRGHPVVLGRTHWVGVAAASTGDSGARHYLNEHSVTHVPCDDVSKGFDIDRPEDLHQG
jgi:CTP:molybdopterin cytidylyltransferase MocA